MSTPAPATPGANDSFADGEWHRMHPLTPLFKGGLALIIVAGIVISNMRDRLITWFVSIVSPDAGFGDYVGAGDPIEWVLENNFVLLGLLILLGIVVLLVGIFWMVWRFQQFRITGEHVEVRKGVIFRSQRRAPLDRVQGVNLTRPFPARIIGLAKLEVVGAGTDANVPLEYLATSRAEAVRADILRLASGARAARLEKASGALPADARTRLVGSVNEGVTSLIAGVDLADVAVESVVKIPTGRLVGSQLLSGIIWIVFFGALYAVGMIAMGIGIFNDSDTTELEKGGIMIALAVGLGLPFLIAVIGITWAQISKSLRYSIAPTPDGVRITFGLLTTVTETIPPGRIFAVEVTQSLLWRPFGWWTVKINRMTGKSLAQQQSGTAQQFNIVLPVGTRADVERVLALIMPDAPDTTASLVLDRGLLATGEEDSFETMAARAWWRRPFSWRRHGFAITDFALFQRRGFFWRKVVIFPLARLQGFSLSQGPIDRLQRVSGAQAHSIMGPVTGLLSGIERDSAVALLDRVSEGAARASAADHGHRWGEHSQDATPVPVSVEEVSPVTVVWPNLPSAPQSPLAPPLPPAPPAPGA